MRWARDVVEEVHTGIRSVKSLLTVMMRVTVGGMDADPTVVRDSTTSLDDSAGIATATSTASVAEIAEIDFAIVIGNIDGGGEDRLS